MFSFIQKVSGLRQNLNKLSIRSMSVSRGSPFDCKIISIENLDNGKWIQTRKINYQDPLGQERVWEMAIRTTRPAGIDIDGVAIIALMRKKNAEVSVLLTKQFRPPIGKVCIDFPAGLVDPHETVKQTAERELLEETGYYGKFSHTSNPKVVLASDPGLTSATMISAFVDVDMEDPRNQNPVQKLEASEFIDVFHLPIRNLYPELMKIAAEENCAIDSRLYNFAEGADLMQNVQ